MVQFDSSAKSVKQACDTEWVVKLVFDWDAGVIALIVRGEFKRADVDLVLSPMLDAKAKLRAVRRPVRIMLIANSDAESGFEIASRMIGLREDEDRLALVVGVDGVHEELLAKMDGLPARVFRRSSEALTWLRNSAA